MRSTSFIHTYIIDVAAWKEKRKLPVAIATCIQNMLLDVIAEIDVSQSVEVNV